LLVIQNNNGWVFWLGDSVLYHFRNKTLINKTEEHTLLNLIKKSQQNSSFENDNSIKHIITKSIKAGLEKVEPDSMKLLIQKNDVLFLCSDGVKDYIPENTLFEILNSNELNIAQKKEKIVELCKINSKDNFSGIIIECS
jgi:protein phosphatase